MTDCITTRNNSKKLVVFGGAFNPPTLAHFQVLNFAKESLNSDLALFVPVGDNYNKPTLINSQHRVNMLKNLCVTYRDIKVDTVEVDSVSNMNTIDTLKHLSNIYPDYTIYFLTGADNLSYFTEWDEWENILDDFKLAVLPREGYNITQIINNTQLYKYKNSITELPLKEFIQISSTMVRECIKNNDVDTLEKYLDDTTIKYICEHNLYR